MSDNQYHLHDITDTPDMQTIRGGFGLGLKEAGDRDDTAVGLCADLTSSTNMNIFAEAHPEPNGPLVDSSPGSFVRSGWPCRRDPNWRRVFSSFLLK